MSSAQSTYANVRIAEHLLGISILGVLSLAVALGWTLDLHDADSLIPTLVSLDFWLPFYWGQDRFGMLLPLVTAPVRDSFWNLVAQNALGVLLMLAGAYVAAVRCAVRQPQLVALALLSLVLAWPAETTALYLLTTNQSYSPALGLYAFAFGLLRPDSSWPTRTGAALLMALGAWTNAGTGLLMLAVFAVAAVMPRLRPVARWLLGGVILSLAGHLALQMLAPGVRLDRSHVTLASLADVTALAAGFWSDAYQRFLGPAFWLSVLTVLLALALERRSAIALQAIIAIVVGCTLYAFAVVVFFGGTGRHITPTLPLLCGAILVVFARHLPAASGMLGVAALTMAIVLIQASADWPEAARRRLDIKVGRRTRGRVVSGGRHDRNWRLLANLAVCIRAKPSSRGSVGQSARFAGGPALRGLLSTARAAHHARYQARGRPACGLSLLVGPRTQG